MSRSRSSSGPDPSWSVHGQGEWTQEIICCVLCPFTPSFLRLNAILTIVSCACRNLGCFRAMRSATTALQPKKCDLPARCSCWSAFYYVDLSSCDANLSSQFALDREFANSWSIFSGSRIRLLKYACLIFHLRFTANNTAGSNSSSESGCSWKKVVQG